MLFYIYKFLNGYLRSSLRTIIVITDLASEKNEEREGGSNYICKLLTFYIVHCTSVCCKLPARLKHSYWSRCWPAYLLLAHKYFVQKNILKITIFLHTRSANYFVLIVHSISMICWRIKRLEIQPNGCLQISFVLHFKSYRIVTYSLSLTYLSSMQKYIKWGNIFFRAWAWLACLPVLYDARE